MTETTLPPLTLTRRERQCLTLLAKGLRVDAIAATLGTAPQTVEKQIAEARARLGARTATQAVVIALQHNLLDAADA
ncbi:response regulator transcription factor [Novispirillum itersonii]|uniref:response regulator transcription factor n=1 Tax=Novispirillum itersonii TaxID=189 RepID=UPI000374C517|nr:helix-turn-helix transcriptional regulator [Novispirillum itersonii]